MDAVQVTIAPQLSVRRGREAVEFYKDAFGAVEIYRVGGIDGHEAVVSQLTAGNGSFWVADESPEHMNFSPESVGSAQDRNPLARIPVARKSLKASVRSAAAGAAR